MAHDSRKLKSLPWTEKYRPKRVDDLVIDPVVKNRIRKYVTIREMPDLLITGVPGIGKTTTILCLAHNILGRLVGRAVLEINASDDRGIKTVEDEITSFCKKKVTFDHPGQHKIVLLDEMDNMTTKAQQKVNLLMEKYHKTTRFAFTCNDSTKIIEGIQSRCTMMWYKRLSIDEVSNRLEEICHFEKVDYTSEGLKALADTACGDMRHAINNLQLIHSGFGEIKPDYIYQLCDKPNPAAVYNIFHLISKKDLPGALQALNQLFNNGYPVSDISLSMLNVLKQKNDLPEDLCIVMIDVVSQTLFTVGKGIDSPLQLTGCVCELYLTVLEY